MANILDPNAIYTPAETAALLGIAERTLTNWRCVGKGPRPTRLHEGERAPVKYTGAAIAAYLAERTADWPSATATAS